jgi:hypothetical protein
MSSALKQGLFGAGAWVLVGTTMRVTLQNAAVVDAVTRSLPGAIAFGAVYAFLAHRRAD